jgi:hypothetical protein
MTRRCGFWCRLGATDGRGTYPPLDTWEALPPHPCVADNCENSQCGAKISNINCPDLCETATPAAASRSAAPPVQSGLLALQHSEMTTLFVFVATCFRDVLQISVDHSRAKSLGRGPTRCSVGACTVRISLANLLRTRPLQTLVCAPLPPVLPSPSKPRRTPPQCATPTPLRAWAGRSSTGTRFRSTQEHERAGERAPPPSQSLGTQAVYAHTAAPRHSPRKEYST